METASASLRLERFPCSCGSGASPLNDIQHDTRTCTPDTAELRRIADVRMSQYVVVLSLDETSDS